MHLLSKFSCVCVCIYIFVCSEWYSTVNAKPSLTAKESGQQKKLVCESVYDVLCVHLIDVMYCV